MALNFPLNPSIGQQYISGNFSYIWTGSKWKPENRKYKILTEGLTNSANTTNIDLSLANVFTLNLSDKTNINFINPPPTGNSQRFFIRLGINSNYIDAGDNISYDIGTGTIYDNYYAQIPYDIRGIRFSSDGLKVFISFYSTTIGEIRQYNLTSPWNLSTGNFSTPASTLAINSVINFDLKPDGTAIYAATGNNIFSYSLSTPWNLTGASQTHNYVSELTSIYGMRFGNSGKNLYLIASNTTAVRQYNLSTPWNMATAQTTSSTTFSTTSQVTSPLYDAVFDATGTKMMVVGTGNDVVAKYNLSSAWNILTASFTTGQLRSVTTQATLPMSVEFNSSGSKMFISNANDNRIYQYITGGSATTNTIPTVTWPTNIKWENGSPPTLPELTQTDLLEFYTYDGGTTYYGKVVIDNIK